MLTADSGTIDDVDGLPSGSFPSGYTFQWVSVDGSETDIANATSQTYMLTDSEIGKKVKVKVSFEDGAGNSETVTSDAYPSSGTIADPRGVTLSRSSLDVSEGSTGSYTVVLDAQPTGDVTVTPSSGDTSAATASPVLTFNASNWSVPQTVTVSAVADNDTANETVTITHTVSGADYASVTAGDVAVRVYDDGSMTAVLVSNTGQSRNNNMDLISVNRVPESVAVAQEFTIAGSAGAYRLYSVRLALHLYGGSDDVSISIWTKDAEGNPGTRLYTLTDPGTITDNSLSSFTAPVDAAIARNTPYFVVVEASVGEFWVQHTRSGAEDAGGAAGSIISDNLRQQSSSLIWTTVSAAPLRIAVRGAPRSTNNTPATGRPAISGTATVGQMLTAGLGTVHDIDCLPSGGFPAGYAFQWIRVESGSETVISGETERTYTLADLDAGNTVKVRVSFTDGAGNAETRTSDAYPSSGTITTRGVTVMPTLLEIGEGNTGSYTVVLDTQPIGEVTVTPASGDAGAVTVSEALTFTATNWATAQTVTVTAVDDADTENETVTVTHTVAGADYGSVTAADVTVRVDDDEVAVTTLISNTGESENTELEVGFDRLFDRTTLRAQKFTIAGTGSYLLDSVQLDLSDYGGSDDVQVSIYTANSGGNPGASLYTLTDPGTITNNSLNTFAAPENAVIAANTAYFVYVAAPGGKFYVSLTDSGAEDSGGVSGSTIEDQHRRSTNSGTSWISSTRAIRIAVRGSPSAGANNPAIGRPAISGTAVAGEVLTARQGTIDDADGLPSGSFPSGYTFQWVSVDGSETDIANATSQTYRLTDSEIGKKVKVKVSFEDGAGNSETVTSDAYPSSGTIADPRGVTLSRSSLDVNEGSTGTYTVVLDTQPTGNVTVTPSSGDTGAVTVPAEALTFTTSNWATAQTVTVTAVGDSDSTNETVSVSHTVSGADYASVTAGDVTVRVYDDGSTSAVLVGNTGQSVASARTLGVHALERAFAQEFTIAGSAGAYRLFSVQLEVSDYNSGDNFEVSIWTRGAGGNPGTRLYTLTDPGTITNNRLNTFTAPANAAIARNTPYFVVVAMTSGAAKVTVTTSDAEDAGGASGSTIGNAGRRLNAANAWSALTTDAIRISVRGAPRSTNNTPATGKPAVSGTATVGQMLTVGLGTVHDIDGLPSGGFPASYAFQWIRVESGSDTDISGETERTYTLVDLDAGKSVKVRVSFTDGAGNAETRTSDAYPSSGTDQRQGRNGRRPPRWRSARAIPAATRWCWTRSRPGM